MPLPSVVRASGKKQTLPLASSTREMAALIMLMSLRLLRLMYTVPALVTILPITGQFLSSCMAMKLAG